MNKIPFLAVSALLLTACSTARPVSLDTSSYLVDLAPDGGQGSPDHLVFGPGGFESTACRGYGFRRSEYHASRDGDTTSFEAVAHNIDGATTHWRGTITGEAIAGTMLMTDTSGTKSSFRYRGTRERGALDGRRFKVSLVSDEDHSKVDDDLVFVAGNFDSVACHDFGFSISPYSCTPAGGNTRFEATTTSPQNGSMEWRGSVADEGVSGEVVWKDDKGAAHRKNFTGKQTH